MDKEAENKEKKIDFLFDGIDKLKEFCSVGSTTAKDLEVLLKQNIQSSDGEELKNICYKAYARLLITFDLAADTFNDLTKTLKKNYNNWNNSKEINENGTSTIDDDHNLSVEIIEDSTTDSLKETNNLKLRLVAIEKLLDPKLLDDKPHNKLKSTNIKETITTRNRTTRKCKEAVKYVTDDIIDLDSDQTSSSSDDVPITIKSKTKNPINDKENSESSKNKTDNINSLKETCKPIYIKVNKLPKNLENLMNKYGIKEIVNHRNEIIKKIDNHSEIKTEYRRNDLKIKLTKDKKGKTIICKTMEDKINLDETNKDVVENEENESHTNENSNDTVTISKRNIKSKTDDALNTKTGKDKLSEKLNTDDCAEKEKEQESKKNNSNLDNGKRQNSDSDFEDVRQTRTTRSSKRIESKKSKTKSKEKNDKFNEEEEEASTKENLDKPEKNQIELTKNSMNYTEEEHSNDDSKSKSRKNSITDSKENNAMNGVTERKKKNSTIETNECDLESKNVIENNTNENSISSNNENNLEDEEKEKLETNENSMSSNNENNLEDEEKEKSEDDKDNDTENIITKDINKPNTMNNSSSDTNKSEDENLNRNLSSKKNKKVIISDSDNEKLIEDQDSSPKSMNKRERQKSSESEKNDSSGSDVFQHKPKRLKKENNESSDEILKSFDEEDEDNESKKKKKKRKRIKKISDSEDGSGSENDKKGRKNIRKVMKVKQLKEETKIATKEELERKKRIEERQKMYNKIYENDVEKCKEVEKLVLDFDDETKEELISVDKQLVKKLKPHQATGVKFMWDACFESLSHMKESDGSGCILAHCMGLGKTLQVITLVHTLLTNKEKTGVNCVLVIAPLSTVLNWVNEFQMWMKHCSVNRDIELYELSKFKKNIERAHKLEEWHKDGGVMILGYDMFRNLVNESNSRVRKKIREKIRTSLVDPGPDFVVCDEGHLLKNEKTSISKAVTQLKTLRRVILTGTPLQNNLKEYYCMVQFIKPNLLGKYTEYMNRFVNPITNGQYTDSTPRDIQIMKRRAHVLHKMLDGCVQRRDYSVLAPFLPPKNEYVVFIKLTELQIKLYKYYMTYKSKSMNSDGGQRKSSVLFQDFQNLQRIWTHPMVLRYNSNKYEQVQQKKRDLETESEGSLKDFIDDDDDTNDESSAADTPSSSDSDSDNSRDEKSSKKKNTRFTRKTRSNAKNCPDEDSNSSDVIISKIENPTEWWTSLIEESDLNDINNSGKLMFLFSLLEECEKIGDKVLVFSQSLYSLDVIEHFLSAVTEKSNDSEDNKNNESFRGCWLPGVDYFRLDGSTNIEARNNTCKEFNNPHNFRARLFLISTRAGGLGINLVAANRVVIFDVSWNPSHDIQSIFRVYRFGQEKPCYIYRFIALGTMEEKIYERQVTKLAISKRVIDEQQIDRHYKETDLLELYNYELEPANPRELPILPKDRLFAELLKTHEKFLYKYHEHDSLLENKEEETLDEEERKAAWEEFESEKNKPVYNFSQIQSTNNYNYNRAVQGSLTSNMIYGIKNNVILQLLSSLAKEENPTGTDIEIAQAVPLLLQELYTQMNCGDTTLYQKLLILQRQYEQNQMMLSTYGLGLFGANQNMAGTASGSSAINFPTNYSVNPMALLAQQHNKSDSILQSTLQTQLPRMDRNNLLFSKQILSNPNEIVDLDCE